MWCQYRGDLVSFLRRADRRHPQHMPRRNSDRQTDRPIGCVWVSLTDNGAEGLVECSRLRATLHSFDCMLHFAFLIPPKCVQSNLRRRTCKDTWGYARSANAHQNWTVTNLQPLQNRHTRTSISKRIFNMAPSHASKSLHSFSQIISFI